MGMYEDELKKTVAAPAWDSHGLVSLAKLLDDAGQALRNVASDPGWEGKSSTDASDQFGMHGKTALENSDRLHEIASKIDSANAAVGHAHDAIGKLPAGGLDGWVHAAIVGGSSVVMPGIGTIASEAVLHQVEGSMAGGREAAARKALEQLQEATSGFSDDARVSANGIVIPHDNLDVNPPPPAQPPQHSVPGGGSGWPGGSGAGGGVGGGSGYSSLPVDQPGGYADPSGADDPGNWNVPSDPGFPGTPGDGAEDVGGGGPGTVPWHSSPSVDGGMGGGTVGSGGTGGAALLGGGLGAAAIAGGARLGAGGLGGLAGGAGGLGSAGGVGGLLGGLPRGGVGMGGSASVAGGVGAGGAAQSAGAAGAGARPASGMMGGMGGGGAASAEEKRRKGLWLIAPKLDDEDGQPQNSRTAGSKAGSREPDEATD